ncbi:MAG: hypothetical protein GY793_02640 [Proteobacteria bacterium]|nr:hypothetical protein [Pseudomonadota bacterium]
MNSKGAMFGLDARVALAIFGALSVITGAALYNSIKQAKIVALQTQFEEISKAVIQYSLDSGQDLPMFDALSVKAENLLETDGLSSWKGPYIPAEKITGNHINLNDLNIWTLRTDNSFGNQTNSTSGNICVDKNNCGIWLKATSDSALINMISVVELDKLIDGSDGYDKGKFRVQWADATPSDNLRAFYYVKPAFY